MFSTTVLLSVFVAAKAVFCSPVQRRAGYAVKETHFVPQKWSKIGKAADDFRIHLNIGLTQGNFHELERHLYEVSDPDHDRYGKHLSYEEVNDLIKPSEKSSSLVEDWLRDNGIENLSYSSAKDWVSVSLPISTVESLLDTEYHVYEHEDGGQLVRTSEWSLPTHLHSHIDSIQPTTSFMRASGQKTEFLQFPPWISADYTPPTNETISKVCNISSVTPECFMNLYSTKGYKPKVPGLNTVGFNNFLGEIPIRPDAYQFLQKYHPGAESAAYRFPQISIADGPVQDGPLTLNQSLEGTSREANLDVQAIAGISDPTPIISYSTGGSPPFNPDISTTDNTNEPYLVWLNYVLAQPIVPLVISTSYADDEQTVPKAYAERVCKQFAQLGARGVSVLFASGDRGVGINNTCISNDGKNTTTFVPLFPSGCPYVTTVGATHQFEPEVVAFRPGYFGADGAYREIYSSGGGFSNYFETPRYQARVVREYVKNLNGLYDGLYNKGGRAYPDLAAQGQYFAYVWNGTEGVISGTSASTPLMSGIISLVNDDLLSNGKAPLGFLNPWLYTRGYKGFTDITSGSAAGCGVDGFNATEGWDPVTGFGTPIFPLLTDLAKN
ncbi:tripeptidyl-peptidase 1 precursor [Mollisia scopiformis]|uniref:tripeptidyl-peptidase II n=1 Tax=Mollisia scopiformis TaxID=149040 RepID=A0A132B6Y9_MOLSC|nr:tripeptidyl-peptidase 1 precursor [Mollisia scopiformis]KUJ07644.1 tripeptidyl-peptidase 1 precursor [Mollisia scopiformis]